MAQADNLLDRVKDLQAKVLTILGKAEAAGDLRTALVAIREARGTLELLAKLAGKYLGGFVDRREVSDLHGGPIKTEARVGLILATGTFEAAIQHLIDAGEIGPDLGGGEELPVDEVHLPRADE